MGINFAYWQYVPWVGLYSQGREDAPFIGMGDEFDFNMLTWRHTCFAFSLEDGNSIMYENGKLVTEKVFDEVVEFGKKLSDFIAEEITFGCYLFDNGMQSHPGVVTDFQLFGRVLSHRELEKWTGCEERIEGDLVSWDKEDWTFQTSGNGSRVEYLEFEKEVCDLRNMSHHFFPAKRIFEKALDLCDKVSGKLNW